jgi:nicotinate-nucleotide--dimethylbenzimidazole phosphoribosyltransferase
LGVWAESAGAAEQAPDTETKPSAASPAPADTKAEKEPASGQGGNETPSKGAVAGGSAAPAGKVEAAPKVEAQPKSGSSSPGLGRQPAAAGPSVVAKADETAEKPPRRWLPLVVAIVVLLAAAGALLLLQGQ